MKVITILIIVALVVFLFSKLSGESTEDSLANAGGAGFAVGGCMVQVFIAGISILLTILFFGWLFG